MFYSLRVFSVSYLSIAKDKNWTDWGMYCQTSVLEARKYLETKFKSFWSFNEVLNFSLYSESVCFDKRVGVPFETCDWSYCYN